MINPYFIGIIYEGSIIIIATILLILIFSNYIKTRHYLSLLLFLMFLNYIIAIIFSWFSKILILFSNINYVIDESIPDPLTPLSWILLRITGFRISFLFIIIGTLISYIFKEKVFNLEINKIRKFCIFFYGSFTAIYSIIIYIKENVLFDALAFLFVFILVLAVYSPFMIRAYKSYRTTQDLLYKKAFLSLSIMSLSLIVVFFNFLIDRFLILLGGFGFTIFYFLAWFCVIIAIFGAYYGFLKPSLNIND